MELAKYGAVFVLAASPVGEVLIAVPAGIAMGLHPLSVLVVAVVGNYLPVVAVYLSFAVAERNPRVAGVLRRLARPKVLRVVERYGLLTVLVGTPWLGVYATATSMLLLGMGRGKLLLGTLASIAGYGVVAMLLARLGLALLR
ncbi:MAG: small multi-drug export protein [Chloroflexi bacterium]|nr:small multi-drug export protein [Chloroflexota bacterium]